MIKGLWVDVEDGEVKAVEIEGSTLDAMQQAVGGLIECALTFENGDELFVNQEGLINGKVENWQMWGGERRIFKGNGIIVGLDIESGDTISCSFDKDEVTLMVSLVSPEDAKTFISMGAVK
jgi:hypothetical protein